MLEAVLQQAAIRFETGRVEGGLSAADLEKPVKVRDYLEHVGLLGQKEKEAVAKIYALLSDTGAHPYIAQGDQARLLRHYALTTSQFTLLRLRGALLGGAAANIRCTRRRLWDPDPALVRADRWRATAVLANRYLVR